MIARALLALSLVLAAPLHARTAAAKGSLKGWNVVLITLDATNPQRIGTYGGKHDVMPYFDIDALPAGSEGKNIFGADARQTFTAASSSSIMYESYEVQALKPLPDAAARDKLRADAAELERTGVFYRASVHHSRDGHIHKLLHFGSSKKRALSGGSGAVQLYDVLIDAVEERDPVSEKRSVAASMLRDVREREPLFGRLGIVDGLTSNNPAAMTQGLDREAIEKLKALGYLQ